MYSVCIVYIERLGVLLDWQTLGQVCRETIERLGDLLDWQTLGQVCILCV